MLSLPAFGQAVQPTTLFPETTEPLDRGFNVLNNSALLDSALYEFESHDDLNDFHPEVFDTTHIEETAISLEDILEIINDPDITTLPEPPTNTDTTTRTHSETMRSLDRSAIDANLALLGNELALATKTKTRRAKVAVKRKDERYKRYRTENNKAAAINRALKRSEKADAKKAFNHAKERNEKLIATVAALERRLATLSKARLFPSAVLLSQPPSLAAF